MASNHRIMRLVIAAIALWACSLVSVAAPVSSTMRDCWEKNDHRGMALCVAQLATATRTKLDTAEANMRGAIGRSKESPAYIQSVKQAFEEGVEAYRNYRTKHCQLREALAEMGNGPTENKLACETELDSDRTKQLEEDLWWLR